MLGNTTLTAAASRSSLRGLRLVTVALALAAMTLAATVGTAVAWDPGTFSPADEDLLFSLTNQDRASAGLNALVNDSYLHKEAEWRAKDMGDRDYFSHQIPPSGSTVFNYMQSDGYCFKVAGENIGLSTFPDDTATTSIETAFMGSTSHRENILGTWAHLGVGAYEAADGRKLYDVLFSIPCGVSVTTPAPAKTAAPAPVNPVAPVHVTAPKPTATPTPTPIPTPTTLPTMPPFPTFGTPLLPPSPSATAASTPVQNDAGTPAGYTATSLRVHSRPVSEGPIDSLFHSLFGGLFGW
jgi:uncharacterized protein YkwD